MTTYSIDDGHGNQITAGLQEREARAVATRLANERGESVHLYDAADPQAESVEIDPTTARCECGQWCGVRCEWTGPRDETVIVEWMPEPLRASHTAAGNRGVYPRNGAQWLRVSAECAASMLAHDGEWCEAVTSAGTVHDLRTGEALRGLASVELALESAADETTGAVSAWRDPDGIWWPVPESRVAQDRARGREVVTVWVDA